MRTKIFFILFILIGFIGIVTGNCGNLTVHADSLNNESITWHYNVSDNINQISVNGYIIENFDNQTGFIVWRTPPYSSTDTIMVINESDTGCNTSSILPIETQQETFFGNLNEWFLIGIIILFIILAVVYVPLFGWFALFLSIGGLITAINHSIGYGIMFFILVIVSLFSTTKN